MTPLNDLLKAQVELANARQDLIVAQNNLETAKSNFNILLRRKLTPLLNSRILLIIVFLKRKSIFALIWLKKTVWK